jgi:polyketide biosynthesis enoyl-CoA hydratase PksI
MQSEAVTVQALDERIAQITLQDRQSKNGLSQAVVAGLARAFAAVRADDRFRVAILTGYDNYFCSGGTREALLALHEGHARFTDGNIYSLPLDCEIPVIAAMQGHGIGGGFVLGMFADFVVLGRESVYTANFMQYGFTPGMGATCILPRKLGTGLAQEMMLGARSYRGSELAGRGVAFPVMPRKDVLDFARQLAQDVADKPRAALIALKSHLVAPIRAELPATIAAELQMHAATFHRPEVRQRISAAFDS